MYSNFDLDIFFHVLRVAKIILWLPKKKPPDTWLISQRNDLCCKSKKTKLKKNEVTVWPITNILFTTVESKIYNEKKYLKKWL